ncbi:helix-turn-helix domain-containing protein [Photobacterium alginatilyticum]|uniref:helix-turn-helix domain-containing protein n=1 Tax=Photobacterium alginatilyticum TaxID=1775171 RepID=UPI0040696443
MNIADALKKCRKAKGFTKTKLAELTGISNSYLTLIEQGKREPNLTTIETICSGLNIPVSLFIFLASEDNENNGISKELSDKLSDTLFELIRNDEAKIQKQTDR